MSGVRFRQTLRWLFWELVYFLRNEPEEIDGVLRKLERTRPPWYRFEPYLYHSDDGRYRRMIWAEDSDYTRTATIKVEVHISCETGKVTGLTVFDCELEKIEEARKTEDP